jgi:RNA-splicing ligase RtcB
MADLKIFAKTVEQEVHDQLNKLMSVKVFKDAKVRIMPDTHAGKGCVIGFTADLGDKVVPNLVGVDVGCFTKDTKVKLADGRDISFEDLIKESENGKEHYGYSFNDEGKITISKLDLPRKIKEVDELVEITLDNGEVIHSTLDHIFYDISRNEIEAKDLTVGTSLFPCYIDVAKNHIDDLESDKLKGKLKDSQSEYSVVFQPTDHKWSLCHYLADDYNARHFNNLLSGSYVRHHVDFNKYNNNPTNVQRVTYKEHWKIHADNISNTNKLGITGFNKAAENNPNLFSEAGKKRAESTWRGKNADKNRADFRKHIYEMNNSGKLNSEEQRERARQRQLTNNTTKFAEQNKDPAFKNKQKLSKIRKVLVYCNNDFSKESYNSARQFVYNAFTYDKALEIIKENNTTFEELCNYKNHRIVSVKIIKEHADVYCLTCFEYGNFALSSGVFVHNCGMYVVNIGKLDLSDDVLAELDKFIHEHIPAGFNVNENEDEKVHFDLEQLRMYKHLKNLERLQSSIGTLGG